MLLNYVGNEDCEPRVLGFYADHGYNWIFFHGASELLKVVMQNVGK